MLIPHYQCWVFENFSSGVFPQFISWLSPCRGWRRKATSAADTFHFILIVQTNFQHTMNLHKVIKHRIVASML